MKKIFKYIFISFGLLFLSSFFVVEKTYGGYCKCGISPYGCLCCPCTCACGCYYGCNSDGSVNCKDPTHPDYCANGEYRSSQCTYSCICPDRCENGCNSNGTCYCPTYCVNHCTSNGTCYCSSICVNGCETDGSCKCVGCDYGCYSNGECKEPPTCSVYDSYCKGEYGDKSYSIWSDVSESCVCVEPPEPNPSCPADQVCGDGCCSADTICQNFSGTLRCTEPDSDPGSPPSENNEAPTAPTSLKTEGLTDPNNVSDTTPEFSAIFNDPNTGDNANYYQIQVTGSSPSLPLMWDSGKTSMAITAKGSRSPEISYSGTALTVNNALYYWKIKFWDVGGLESPWSAVSKFRTCLDTTCNTQDQCKPNGFAPVPISSDSILLEDIVSCNYSSACSVVKKYGDCYEDPHIKCTLDTDCDTGECCRGYSCTEDCSPVQSCTANSDCSTGKCCVGGECGECLSSKVRTVKITMGSKESDIVRVGLWDRILAFFKNINTLFY